MTELLFIGITVFFIYVVFQAIGKQEEPEASKEEAKAAEIPEPVKKEPVIEEAAQASPPAAKKPASKRTSKATKTTPPAAPAAAPPEPISPAATATDSLKNPKTGEIAKVAGNYAFAKRWIKDALVEEGLLDKVYKNNELDADTTAKIQTALEKLKSMAKYQ
jgi:hypothetical protein